MSKLAFAILALFVVAMGASPTAPARPPDGTYVYTISGIPVLKTTTIVVRSNGSTFSTIENVALNGGTVSTQTDYDAQTLLPTHYRVYQNGLTTDVSFSAGTAALASPPMNFSKVTGTTGLTISEGLYAARTLLPSIFAISGSTPISDLALNGAKVIELTPTTGGDVRPASVSAGDIETAFTYSSGAREMAWSNPSTHIVDRIDLGGTSLLLASYSTATDAATPAPPATVATPYPTAPPHFTSRDVSFASSGGAVIAGTLTIPNGVRKRMPAFVFIHGSGPETRDGGVPQNPTFLDLSNALSNNGVVVLRYDKRGMGKSTGTGTEDWHPLGDDARAAVSFLRRQPSVDPNRIYLLGHSEGGEIAPLIAPTIPHLAGIVLMAGPAIPMERVLYEQLPGPDGKKLRDAILAGLASYVGIDPAKIIVRVNAPILVLQGGRDLNVLASDLPHLVNAARAAHRAITVRVFPQDDHLFLRLAPTAPDDHSEYEVPTPLDPRVAQAILAWLQTLPTSGR